MSNRDQDRVHLRDMIDVGLVGRDVLDRLPPSLAERLEAAGGIGGGDGRRRLVRTILAATIVEGAYFGYGPKRRVMSASGAGIRASVKAIRSLACPAVRQAGGAYARWNPDSRGRRCPDSPVAVHKRFGSSAEGWFRIEDA